MGDLFVYLDTGPGGTQQVFTPYATPENGTVISLPEGLGADYLVWARSSSQATLLAWNGAWSEVKALGADEFRFDGSRRAGQTDLYLPFELLGLSPASSLGLLALASEEPAEGRSLELWSTLPLANPVNSPKVSRWAGLVGEGFDFPLWRAYRWPALADDVCPSGALDSALEVTITADPAGASLSGLGSGLFWLPDPAPLAALPGDRDYGVLPALHPPLANGQTVEYTVHYRNAGEQAAEGVRDRAERARPGAAARHGARVGRHPARRRGSSHLPGGGGPERRGVAGSRRQGAGLRCRACARRGGAGMDLGGAPGGPGRTGERTSGVGTAHWSL